MSKKNNKRVGNKGEVIAIDFLTDNNYKILATNYKNRIGEIDIIAKYNEYIVFVEVKTRTTTKFGLPCEAVDYRKQNTIGKVALVYLGDHELYNECCRFDIIEILILDEKISISHIQDAFRPKIL